MKSYHTDYRSLDRPEILRHLFHPRTDWGSSGDEDILITVEKDISIGARFHMVEPSAPSILFFHGNGEIVSDYNELGSVYNRIGINFMVVDYRGYGRSNGSPTVTAVMRDCHTIFEFTRSWLKANSYQGSLLLMGRSLGSAPALELADNYSHLVAGLIIESGFAFTAPLLKLLGIDLTRTGLEETEGFHNLEKIENFKKPLLLIHAENDHIIPFTDARALFAASQSKHKKMVMIPGADHNNIFMHGLELYLNAVKNFVDMRSL